MKIVIATFVLAALVSFTNTEKHQVCSIADAPKSSVAPIDLDAYAQETQEPTEFTLSEVVIAASAPKPVHKKVYTCGPMHENLVGGANRDCEWK